MIYTNSYQSTTLKEKIIQALMNENNNNNIEECDLLAVVGDTVVCSLWTELAKSGT